MMCIQKKSIKCSNDNKRLQTFDRVLTYPYGTNPFKVCESEMLSKCLVNALQRINDQF